MRVTALFISLIILLVFLGCDNQRESAEGFALPAGNVEAGAAVYAAMSCGSCHGVKGESEADTPVGTKKLMIGGTSSNLPSDGYLVSAIINPSHAIREQAGFESTLPSGESRMSNFNPVLTVQQLIDVVAYLQSLHEFRTVYEGHGMP